MSSSGVLLWGQAGEYDAISDREVITALADRKIGVFRRPTFSPAGGMNVTLSPFGAVVDCGDDTAAVVATHDPVTISPAAGPLSGGRTDVVWVDIDPDGAAWNLVLVPEVATVGRLGIRLGEITVPQGANLASQCTFRQVPLSFQSIVHRGFVAGAGWQPTGGQIIGVLDRSRSAQIYVGAYRPVMDAQSSFTIDCEEHGFIPSCILGATVLPMAGMTTETGWHLGKLQYHLSTLQTLRFQVINIATGAGVPGQPVAIIVTVYYQAKIT